MIEVEGLTKRYGELTAVDGVSFMACEGEVFGLLGPNGAGKSTTLGCISGLLEPGTGRIRVMGFDVVRQGPASRRALGVVPQELAIYEDLSAVENLRFWGAAYGLRGDELEDRVQDVLHQIGLSDRGNERAKKYSGGMKRRLNLGCGLVHRPRVLLLDEPTAGVDPQSRVRLTEIVRDLAVEGTCVLYTTHYMEEAETLCDRIAIIDRGVLIAQGTLAELRGRVGGEDMLKLGGHFDPKAIRCALSPLEDVTVVHADNRCVRLTTPEASRKLPALFSAIVETGAEVRETTLSQPSLESLFIKLTGKELRE